MDWLETTFYYTRAKSAPDDYDDPGSLRDRVSTTLERLVESGFVDQSGLEIEPTRLGKLASQFYLRLETAERFDRLCGREEIDESAVLRAVAEAAEFDSVSARRDEREAFGAVLGGEGDEMAAGNRKVLAILRAGMSGTTPAELQSDAWVIRQNALRMLAALRAFCERFASPRDANLVRRIEARVEHGISADAVGLTAIEGVAKGRAQKLAAEGLETPEDVRAAGLDALVDAGLSAGVAERILEQARALPSLSVEWRDLPDAIARGENTMAEVSVANDGDGQPAGVRVTVNGVEMSAETRYLGETTLPVGVFGGDAETLTFEVEVTFPELPLLAVTDSRTVAVE
jgi:replicative superfamily II helicase